MDFDNWVARLGIPLASFCVSLVSALVPLVNAEAYLAFATLVFPRESLSAVVLLVTAGQVTGNVALYHVGSGALRLPLVRGDGRLERVRAALEGGRSSLIVFVSALTGLPSFYLVSLASGVLRLRLPRYVLWGSLGRLVRFTALTVSLARLVR